MDSISENEKEQSNHSGEMEIDNLSWLVYKGKTSPYNKNKYFFYKKPFSS